MPHHPGSTLRTRPSLLFRLHDWQDRASWEEFHRLYRRLVHGRARRAGLTHDEAEEVAQAVFTDVAGAIRNFDTDPDRGSFRGWLMTITRRRIADQFESRRKNPALPAPRGIDPEPRTATIERLPTPEDDDEAWDREWQEQVMAAAIERLARQTKPAHFQAFELYVRQNWPVWRVARALELNPAAVYLISHRLTKRLKVEAEKIRAQLA
jgi:RNA polymerase sigma-70 factor (ECF subfamily)